MRAGDGVSIIGFSCRLPGAADPHELWQLLREGRCAVSQIPGDRFATERYLHPNRNIPGKTINFSAGIIPDIFGFDAAFFGMSPREALQTDPQQRLLLQVVWESLEHAGIPPSSLAGSPVGVFVGAASSDYLFRFLLDPAAMDAQMMTGNTLSIISNRISYQFDLKGPSFTVDTACSSSLVALNQACEAVSSGTIDTAIVAGVNILGAPFAFLGFSRAYMLSARGLCRAFDADGDGYVRAEGAVALVIQSTRSARRADRNIHADIVGWGTNSDGRTVGLSMPSSQSQFALLEQVYDRFDLDPANLAFVEAHGTGTRVGDPAEAGAIGRALGAKRKRPLPIGSVKTNIGHLEPASGLAGLLKAMLGLKHGMFPASLHFRTPNPDIPFADLNVQVAAAGRTFEGDSEHLAGVNSFGFGGTNAHIVLRKAKDEAPKRAATRSAPLVISASSPVALRAVAARLKQAMEREGPTGHPAIVSAAAYSRDHLEHRSIVPAASRDEMLSMLDDLAEGRSNKATLVGKANFRRCKVAFAFSGNGSQWPGMGRAAFAHNPRFRRVIEELDRLFSLHNPWSLTEIMHSADLSELLTQAPIAQALLFATQAATVEALADFGIVPCASFGHSAGEVAAAWASNALSLEDAVNVIHVRSTFQETARGQGGMAAVAMSREEVEAELRREDYDGLEIAAVNTGRSITVSGAHRGLDLFLSHARKKRWPFRKLDIAYPFHSRFADPIQEDMEAALRHLSCRETRIPFISTVYGREVKGEQLDGNYWWNNVRRTVDFKGAVEVALEGKPGLILEIGPSPVLTGYMSDIMKDIGAAVVPLASLERNESPDGDPVLKAASRAFVHGASVSMDAVFGPAIHRGTELPAYPWQNVQYRIEPSPETLNSMFDWVHPLLGSPARKDSPTFYNHLDTEAVPWLQDHRIENAVVLSGTAILEMALAAAREVLGEGALELRGCAIFRPLVLETGIVRETMVRVSPEESLIDLMSRPRGSVEWVHHARTRFSRPPANTMAPPTRAQTVRRTAESDEVYRMMDAFRFQYGPTFRRLKSIDLIDPCTAEVTFREAPAGWPAFLLDPAVADSALHGALFALFADREKLLKDKSLVPTRIESLRLFQPGKTIRSCRIQVAGRAPGSAEAEITYLADDDTVVAVASGGRFAEVRLTTGESAPSLYRTLAVPLPNAAVPSRLGMILPDGIMSLAQQLDLVTTKAPPRGDALLLMEAASRAIVYDAFRSLFGAAAFTLSSPSSGVQIRPELLPIAARLLVDLEGDELAERDAEMWRMAPESSLPAPAQLVQSLLACEPERAPEVTFLSFLAQALPDILSAEHPLPRITPSLADALDVASAASGALASTLREIVAATARNWPEGECLRVLVLAARDAAFVRAVGAAVPLQIGRITVSDDRADRLERLRGQVGSQTGFQIHSWDNVNAEFRSSFDIVVGCELLQGCPNPADMFSKIRELLVEEGSLILAEPLPSIFHDLRRIADLSRPDATAASDAPALQASQELLEQLVKEAGLGSVGVASLKTGATDALFVTAVRERASAPIQVGDRTAFSGRHLTIVESDASAFGTALQLQLSAFGCTAGQPPSAESGVMNGANGHNGSQTAAAQGPDEIVVLAWSPAEGDPTAWVLEHCASMMSVLKSFGERTGRVWLVAPGAIQALGGRKVVRPESAALWGFARVASNEYANLDIRLIDVSPVMPPEQAARRVAEEILLARNDRELLIDNTATFGLRLVCDEVALAGTRAEARGETSRLEIELPGSLDRLAWRPAPRPAPSTDQVEIEVQATGLNFRDIMWSLGLLPAEALESGFAGPTIGMECAGVVTRIGAGVSRLSAGERCVAFAPAAFAQHVVVPEFAVAKLPEGIGAEAAATIPVAFLTAYYSLKHLARLSAGETVLIHGGAGGVGLAAIQIVKWLGATPIATAGSPEKRALLQMLGVEHVLHSRSHSFVDGVMEITSGQGVDVVLNSLAGEAMERSIGCLRSFGRFVELGKRDFFTDTRVGLRPFRKNLSYFGVDADQLLTGQRSLAQQLFGELLALFECGNLSPLPHRIFSGADVTPAFRLMQQAGHVGKIVVRPAAASVRVAGEAGEMKVRPDGTYVIIGGFGGFGLALARRLARRGARHVGLVGRSGASGDEAKQAVAELRAAGVAIYEEAVDAADTPSLVALFARLSREAPPVRGVFHAAMVLDDTLIRNLSVDRIKPVLRAKITSATVLDRITRGMVLDWFVLFSSAATLVGNPGQANYVAANAFLEGLAQQRRAAGFPAVAIAWGAISDAGYLARKSNASELLSRKLDRHSLTVEDALDALERILELDQAAPDMAALGFARLDWRTITKELRIASTPLLEFLRQENSAERGQESSSLLVKELGEMPLEKARVRVAEMLCIEIGRILRIPAAQIDRAKPLSDIGVDSLMGVELRLAAEERLGVEIPLMSIGGAGSLNDLAGRIVKHVREKSTEVMTPELATLAQLHSDTDNVNTEDLTAIAAAIEKREAAVKRVF